MTTTLTPDKVIGNPVLHEEDRGEGKVAAAAVMARIDTQNNGSAGSVFNIKEEECSVAI